MRIEQATKRLSDRCLSNKFEGFSKDVNQIHCDLTMLSMWAVNKETSEIFKDIFKQE
jgi:hypothetical protein